MAQTLVLLSAFLAIGLWETFRPRKNCAIPPRRRWFPNVALGLGNLLLISLVLPTAVVASIGWAPRPMRQAWDALGRFSVLEFVIAFLLIDLVAYGLHRLLHAVPALWRVHRIHHADPELDVSTALRHHPIEDLGAAAVRTLAIVLLGVPLPAASAYVVAATLSNYCQHGNLALRPRVDALVSWLFITPDAHRIHHSTAYAESNSNFGSVFSVWDRLVGTLAKRTPAEHAGIQFGVAEFPGLAFCALHRILAMPFISGQTSPAAEHVADPL